VKKKIQPVSRVVKIEAEINRMVGEQFSDRRKFHGLDESWVPWVDISEKGNEVLVEIELPGVAERDITILLSHNRVEIKGIKRRTRFRNKVQYLRLEREYGPFRRFVSFPCAIIPEKSKAILENGILLLILRKYRATRKKEVLLEIGKSEE
jgi:HSP20 family protein